MSAILIAVLSALIVAWLEAEGSSGRWAGACALMRPNSELTAEEWRDIYVRAGLHPKQSTTA